MRKRRQHQRGCCESGGGRRGAEVARESRSKRAALACAISPLPRAARLAAAESPAPVSLGKRCDRFGIDALANGLDVRGHPGLTWVRSMFDDDVWDEHEGASMQ